eukprot:1908089-Pleurochrysis_carterae.AAC.2
MIHDFTGMLWGLDRLAQDLEAPCIGIQCSDYYLRDCTSVAELATRYLRQVMSMSRSRGPVQLIAYSFGCRIAYRMASLLHEEGQR